MPRRRWNVKVLIAPRIFAAFSPLLHRKGYRCRLCSSDRRWTSNERRASECGGGGYIFYRCQHPEPAAPLLYYPPLRLDSATGSIPSRPTRAISGRHRHRPNPCSTSRELFQRLSFQPPPVNLQPFRRRHSAKSGRALATLQRDDWSAEVTKPTLVNTHDCVNWFFFVWFVFFFFVMS